MGSSSTKDREKLYVVGIGSSAGGLDALKSFFNGVKSSANIAFVIIQHQNPEYKTLLPKLLSKDTDIPIKIIDDKEKIEPKIYVAPPGKNVEVKNGKFIISEPSGGYSPSPSVDYFFDSLGNEYRDRAFGVILSGTGGDGSIGIRTIKAEDGIVFVQDLEEAAYDGMPSSAVETGIVDFVLQASKMVHEIERLCSEERDGILSNIKDADEKNLNPIFTLLSEQTGVDFQYYKPATVARRIERRMVATKNYDIKSYKDYIQNNHHEIKLLFKDLLIGVTSFFRDTEAFEDLKENIREYIKNKSKNTLRLWSAGCSTGEEAYTLAILLHELLGEKITSYGINIFATDLDEDSIIKARKGIYPQSSFLKMDKRLLNRYFTFKNGHFEANKKIRDMIIFSKHNVIKDPPFVKLDIISCRNMMIYMDQSTQKRLFEVFHYSLNADGILFLGKSENASGETKFFKPISLKSKIFKRVAGIGKTPISIYGKNKKPILDISSQSRTQNSLEDEITQAIIDTVVSKELYACVVLNENLELLYTQGDITKYLKLPQGRMNANIYKLINSSFSVELRAAITKALKDDTPATKHTMLKKDDGRTKITIHAASIKSLSSGNFIVLLFKEDEINDSVHTKELVDDDNGDTKYREKELEEELYATREYLQTVVEELETSNEELQALNEELQASNEELQATNEEMETSNEELSSTNEELQSAYSELKSLYTEREEKRKVLQLYVDELKESQKLLELKNRELIDFQKELSQKESLLSSIYETTNIGICITDEKGRFVKVNRAYMDIYGYSERELIGYHFTKVVPKENHEMATKAHDDFIAGTEEIPTEWDVVGKNNKKIKILVTAARLKLDGDKTHKITTLMDITEYSKAQNKVVESENKFRTIFNSTLGMVFIYPINDELRPEGIVDANDATLEFLGYSKEKLKSLSIRDIIKDFDEKSIVELHKDLIIDKNKTLTKFLEDNSGNPIFAEIEASLIKVDGKNSVFMIARNINDKIEYDKKFNLVNLVFDNMNEGIVVTDSEQNIIMTNSKIEEIMGYTKEKLIGQTPKIFKSDWHGKKFYKEMWSSLNENGFWEGEIWDRRQNGEFVAEWLRISSVKDPLGNVINYIAVTQEITDRKKQEEKIQHLAYFDALTDLPNRVLFNDRLDLAIKRAKRSGKKVAIVFIDIDRFKAINDTYGHKVGDEVLIETANRIKKRLRSQDTASRLSGDEFTILIEEINEAFEVTSLLNKLVGDMKEPMRTQNYEIHTSISMGVSIYPDDADSSEELIKNADSAMYNAKNNHSEHFSFYTKKMSEGLKRKLEINRLLREALKNKQLYLNYQPQVCLETNRVVGVESLIRWNSPELGLVSPVEFIDVAEENGLIHEIGIFVLKEAIEFYKEVLCKLKGDIKISVNISPKELDTDNFQDVFEQIVLDSKIDPKKLDIEITENIFANRSGRVVENLNALKRKGVLISIDDFGTGYSSLSYITRFEPDKIKIDRSFIKDMEQSENVRTLISTVIDMSHSLKCKVIAEGAESKNDVELLKKMGCDEIQGYYFSKPLGAKEVEEYIKKVNK